MKKLLNIKNTYFIILIVKTITSNGICFKNTFNLKIIIYEGLNVQKSYEFDHKSLVIMAPVVPNQFIVPLQLSPVKWCRVWIKWTEWPKFRNVKNRQRKKTGLKVVRRKFRKVHPPSSSRIVIPNYSSLKYSNFRVSFVKYSRVPGYSNSKKTSYNN